MTSGVELTEMNKHSNTMASRYRTAAVRELSICLLNASTATEALLAWCEARGISSGPITVVRQKPGKRSDPDDHMLDELRPRRDERIAYRSVRLVRGRVLLSEADN
ncbi:MAG: hypothetical protein AB7G13_23610 [Lautropia sp.]